MIDFLVELEGKEIDLLTDEEKEKLHAAYAGRALGHEMFRCTTEGCEASYEAYRLNGAIALSGLVVHLDKWPCMQNQGFR